MSTLPLPPADFLRLSHAVLARLERFLTRLPGAPMGRMDQNGRTARHFLRPPPELPRESARVIAELFEQALPGSLETAGGGYMGFIPGGGLPEAALGDLIGGVINRYTGLYAPAPALVSLEISLLRWLSDLAAYPTGAGGLLLSGGSMANLTALVAAREAHLGAADPRGRIYLSASAHHSIRKAARIAGFGPDAIIVIPEDARHALDPEALARQIDIDRTAGFRPFLVVAQAGSTPLGVVDPLDRLADLAQQKGLWLHVDAAYGGAFLLTARGRTILQGIARTDSITLDPHKGLFLPYGTGCLLVRDARTLQRAFSEEAAYLPTGLLEEDRYDFAALGPELSRPARGLRLWLPLHLHGTRRFEKALDERLDQTHRCFEAIRQLPAVRVVAPPDLSLFAIRLEPPDLPPEAWDGFNRRVLARVNQMGRVFLTGTTVDLADGPAFCVRVCVLALRTTHEDVDNLIADLSTAIADPRR